MEALEFGDVLALEGEVLGMTADGRHGLDKGLAARFAAFLEN